jgi:hypothetical protein
MVAASTLIVGDCTFNPCGIGPNVGNIEGKGNLKPDGNVDVVHFWYVADMEHFLVPYNPPNKLEEPTQCGADASHSASDLHTVPHALSADVGVGSPAGIVGTAVFVGVGEGGHFAYVAEVEHFFVPNVL